MRYIALIALLSLILGLPTVHFQHHLNLPDFDKDKISSKEVLDLTYPFYHKETDIRLKTEIKGNATQRDVYRILNEAKDGDKVTFHLGGYGGDGFTMFQLINDIKTSKAYIKMIVESPVFSAHAYLATAGRELVMLPYSFLMFHTMSGYGTDCSKAVGTDRTVSNVEHCQASQDALDALSLKFITETPVMTMDEKLKVLTGHDVYISADVYNERVRKHEQ